MDTKKLRQKILDLAIRGKLVPQDPTDEPASALIEKIREEKEQLIKEKKIKRNKNESHIYRSDKSYYEKFADGTVKCIDEEIPFEVPDAWKWVRLGEVIQLVSGQDFPPEKYNSDSDGVPYIIGASNILDEQIIVTRWTLTPSVISIKGDLLLTCKGSGVGKMGFLQLEKVHIARQLMALRSQKGLEPHYLKLFLNAQIEIVKLKANGLIPGLTREVIQSFLFPLPPYKEQKRIIIEIERAFKEIRNIEENKSDLKQYIQQIKSKVLDLAIRGKLVSQDPNDEPASVLLERIKSEHPESKKKASKTSDNSHYPFNLPESWEWTTIGSISQHNTGKTLDKNKNRGDFHKYITTSNLYWNSFLLKDLKEMPFTQEELSRCTALKGDLLICEGGEVGRSSIWDKEYPICFQNHIHRVRPFCGISSRFIYFYMLYIFLNGDINKYKKGIGIQSLSGSSLSSITLPLPPLEEQKRIVQKIENIFILIDAITESIEA